MVRAVLGVARLLPALLAVAAIPANAQAATICPPTPEAPETAPASQPGEATIACVGSQPLTEATFDHWAQVAAAGAGGKHPLSARQKHAVMVQVMGFLLSAAWVQGEARALDVRVTPAAVRRQFEQIRHQQFRHNSGFLRFLKETKQTVADLLTRVELDMLSQRIQRRIAAAHRRAKARQRALAHFIRHFREKWTAQTYCLPRYAVPDCGHVQATL
jgi:hypothetical protein